MMPTLESGHLRFRLIGDDPPLAELTDLTSGAVWGPVPPFTLDVYSVALRRTEDRSDGVYAVTPGDGWIEVTQTVDDVLFSAEATVRFTLEAGDLVARGVAHGATHIRSRRADRLDVRAQ
ncbi:MAG: hypothetical protein JO250_03790 [Armatimonadetes bacterium]|nr:hypothetical protein [Armatimonadota bacterium]